MMRSMIRVTNVINVKENITINALSEAPKRMLGVTP